MRRLLLILMSCLLFTAPAIAKRHKHHHKSHHKHRSHHKKQRSPEL